MISTARQKSKFRSLVRRLRTELGSIPIDAETVAIGILERLWHTTATDAIRGDIGRLTNDDIAESVGWHGDANQLVDILTECRWLDAHDEYRLVVHDWHAHSPNHVKGNVTKLGGFVQNPASRDGPQGTGQQEEPQGTGAPNQTKPNLTNPIPTNPTQPGRPVSLLVVQIEEVRRQSEKIRKVSPSLPGDFIWTVAWVASSLHRGLVGDICGLLRGGGIRKQERYVEGVMRNACSEAGHDWEDLKFKVPCSKKTEVVE